jgi:hypothetical protein
MKAKVYTDMESRVKNVPCDQCICFTVDYEFHLPGTISLDDRLADPGAYTSDHRYYFKLPWIRKDTWPHLPSLRESALAGCALCGILRTKLLDEIFQLPDPPSGDSELTIKAELAFEELSQRKPTGVAFNCQFAGQEKWHLGQPTFILAASRGGLTGSSWSILILMACR